MKNKKLLLVIGAGASIDFGMPSVSDVRQIISAEAQRYYPLTNTPKTNLYAFIEDRIKRYWKKHVNKALWKEPQFEDTLFAIFASAAVYPAHADTSPLGALLSPKPLPEYSFRGDSQKSTKDALRQLGNQAVDTLLAAFREKCMTAENVKSREFNILQSFVRELRKHFDISAVTLNYDNVVYRALKGIETGFNSRTGRFNEDQIFSRKDWPCMLHLHGSVHFCVEHPTHEIYWHSDLSSAPTSSSLGTSTQAHREGFVFPTSTIVAGYGKTLQMQKRPFRTYYSELDRLVSHCDAVLFLGYGFGDLHVNLSFERFRDDRKRPVVVIGKAKKGTSLLTASHEHSHLGQVATEVFRTSLESFEWLGHNSPGNVDDLIDAKEFEVSSNSNTPMSIWYNGILDACENAEKVIAQLARK